jgi:predicted RNase H-like HicB family nuclease/DNA-binding XRE family transcriptional regulator
MWIEGKLEKGGKFWAASMPALEVYTQGRTKKEAYFMAKDALEGLAEVDGFDLDITVMPEGGELFRAGANDTKAFTAFVLRRWRQAHNLTLAEASERLGAVSKNAYARYEQGRSEPTISMMERLIHAISPGEPLHVVFGGATR